jgi:hypothetical protein
VQARVSAAADHASGGAYMVGGALAASDNYENGGERLLFKQQRRGIRKG